MHDFGPLFQGDEKANAAIEALLDALRRRHGASLRSLIFYGSCLRNGNLEDGLVDLYAIVDNYRHAHGSSISALTNHLLAPNVYYVEAESGGRKIRCKYAVFSERELGKGVSARRTESYLWGRLCQPVAIAWAADNAALSTARAALRQASITFLDEALPLAADKGYVREIWATGLGLSYATELRSESPDRAIGIADQSALQLIEATASVAPSCRWPLHVGGEFYTCVIPEDERRRAARKWARRRVQGKVLSVLRLLKALFTFDGGLDYIAWKLERHTGRPVEIPPHVRRFPLLFVWGFMWKLYRQGYFR